MVKTLRSEIRGLRFEVGDSNDEDNSDQIANAHRAEWDNQKFNQSLCNINSDLVQGTPPNDNDIYSMIWVKLPIIEIWGPISLHVG